MKKKILCMTLALMVVLSTATPAKPQRQRKLPIVFDNELGIVGDITIRFASDGGSFIRPITMRCGESVSLESYIPTKQGYSFAGWYSDPRTKQNHVTTFKFVKPDVVYAKWVRNKNEVINYEDEIMSKDTCYLTDEEMKIRTEIIKHKNNAYIEGFGYVLPSKTKSIIAGSDGDINKTVGIIN